MTLASPGTGSAAPQYLAVTEGGKLFTAAAGSVLASYDNGVTWLLQGKSGTVGSCCYGNRIWSFGINSANWKDYTFFKLVEPRKIALEVLPKADLADWYDVPGKTGIPMASFQLVNQGTEDVSFTGLTVQGTGKDLSSQVTLVSLYLDADGDGKVSDGDTLLDTATFNIIGQAAFSFAARTARPRNPVSLLVTWNFAAGANLNEPHGCSVPVAGLVATAVQASGTGTESVTPSAPSGSSIEGRRINLGQTVMFEGFEAGMTNWTVSELTPPYSPWEQNATRKVTGAYSGASVATERNGNYGNNMDMTWNAALDLSSMAGYRLVFMEYYHWEPLIYGRMQVSGDGGDTWYDLQVHGDPSVWDTSGGLWKSASLDLSPFAGQSVVRLRFRCDWTSDWYHTYHWFLDDVHLVRIAGLNTYETFESGGLSAKEWTTGGDAPWSVVTTSPKYGTYCAKSGSIGNNQSSSLSLTLETGYGTISFWAKVDSPDYLVFYIDGVEQGRWRNVFNWTPVNIAVEQGEHTLTWAYETDGTSVGSQAAYLDNISIPLSGIAAATVQNTGAMGLLLEKK